MLPPKFKNVGEGVLNFRRTMWILRDFDRETFNIVATVLKADTWLRLLERLQESRPDLHDELERLLLAAEQKVESLEGINVRRRLQEIRQHLMEQYDCAAGFLERPKTKTVVVYLKHPEPITGLPREIIRKSDALAKDHGTTRTWTFGWDNRIFTAEMDIDAIEELRKNPLVEKVEISEPVAHILTYPYNVPPYNPNGETIDWGVSRINPALAWAKGIKGKGVNVCVCDTGIKYDHEDFLDAEGNQIFKGGYNFVANNEDVMDDHGHGSFCSGLIVSQWNGKGYKGIAPECNFYHCKVMDAKGQGSFAGIAAAIDWCRTHRMDIISLSLGGSSGDATLKAACDNAWYAGCLLAVAAGNEGPLNPVGYPAQYESCMAVAASDFDDYIAYWSCRGVKVEIAAPGRLISSVYMGSGDFDNRKTPDGKYMCASGTSASTPIVAGAAALVKCWYPLISNIDLRNYLVNHARDI